MPSKVWDKVEQKLRCLRAIRRAEIEDTERFVLAKNIVLVLNHRFGSTPPNVRKRLDALDDLDRLRGILQQALSVDSIDDLDP